MHLYKHALYPRRAKMQKDVASNYQSCEETFSPAAIRILVIFNVC